MKEKIFEGYLMVNWQKDSIRSVKNKPEFNKMNPYEIPVKFKIKIKMPQIKDVPMEIEAELPIIDTTDIKMWVRIRSVIIMDRNKEWQETINQVKELTKIVECGNLNYDDMTKVREFISTLKTDWLIMEREEEIMTNILMHKDVLGNSNLERFIKKQFKSP